MISTNVHQTDNTYKSELQDRDAPFRNRTFVQGMFYLFVILAGLLTFAATTVNNSIVKIVASIFIVVMIGLAFAVLSKGDNMKTRDKIDNILKKLDRFFENRSNVFQNK